MQNHLDCSRRAGTVIEPFEADRRALFGIDVQLQGEAQPQNEHDLPDVVVPSFYLDRAPVGMARYTPPTCASPNPNPDPTLYLNLTRPLTLTLTQVRHLPARDGV